MQAHTMNAQEGEMTVVSETRVVNGPIGPAWEEVAKMGAVQDWHPNVAQVIVLTDNDTGVGASRRVEFHDGNGTVETVVEESERQFTKVEMTGSPMIKKAFVTISTRNGHQRQRRSLSRSITASSSAPLAGYSMSS